MKKSFLIISILICSLNLYCQDSDSTYICGAEYKEFSMDSIKSQIMDLFCSNFILPESAKNDTVSGVIKSIICVSETGLITNIIIKTRIKTDLEQEVLKVLKLIRFKSALLISDKGVPFSVELPLTFDFTGKKMYLKPKSQYKCNILVY